MRCFIDLPVTPALSSSRAAPPARGLYLGQTEIENLGVPSSVTKIFTGLMSR